MNALRYLLRSKVMLVGLLLALPVVFWYGIVANQSAKAINCRDTNDIMCDGYNTTSYFVFRYNANREGDLPTIYSHFGLQPGQIGQFGNFAKHATVYKDGRVILDDGTIVATDAYSLGRNQFNGQRRSINIGGKIYYYSRTQDGFASNSLGAYVFMNDDTHTMGFTALTDCGNPVWGSTSEYKCTNMNQRKINDTTYAYSLSVHVRNAAPTKVVYDFGDGTSQTVTGNIGVEVTHTYAPGDYTARVTAYFNSFGQEKSDTRAECTKPVHVSPPPKPIYTCKSLTGAIVEGERTKFAFTATATTENGAVLKQVIFKYDDGTTETIDANGDVVTRNHAYIKDGEHVTSVDMVFNVGKDTGNKNCVTETTTKPAPIYACKSLTGTQVNNERTKFAFTATATTENGAVLKQVIFKYDDGTTETIDASSDIVTRNHAYNKVGIHVTKADMVFNVGKDIDNKNCVVTTTTKPTPPKPIYACKSLTADQVDNERTKFAFTATATTENGAVLKQVIFKYDDGTTETIDANGDVVTRNHAYNKDGIHVTKADMVFNVGKDIGNKNCIVTTTTKPTPPKPIYACKGLVGEAIDGSRTIFGFNASATAKNGAVLQQVTFVYDDGTKDVVKTSDLTTIRSHQYSKVGIHVTRVEMKFNVGSDNDNPNCIATTTTKPNPAPKPIYTCNGLTAEIVSGSRTDFKFTTSATAKNGAVLQQVTFVYDDGTKDVVTALVTTDGKITRTHSYTKDGVHDTKVEMKFNVGNDNDNPKCVVKTVTTPQTCTTNPELPQCKPKECKPGIPEGDNRCNDVPKELPSTGPEQIIGGTMGIGALAGTGIYYRNTRRKFIDAILNKKQ
jgi:hypothetical protein